MKSKTFIDRPILAGVISVIILIVGLIGLSQLPVEQFPEIAPPTINVSASYSGANAETVQKSVVVPLEEALNGVENMMYMVSTAANTGSAKITVYFRQGTDPDMATVNVQNRIATAQGQLPAEVTKSGITVRKRQTSNIKILSLYSPDNSFDESFLNNYLKINIEPRLSRIAGVGEVNVMGSDYSMRVWLDPGKMAKFGLEPSDIETVLDEQNVESPTGTLGADSKNTFQYVLKYRGRYDNEKDYGNLVIRSLPDGRLLRLKDVARIELGSMAYTYINEVDGHPGSTCSISQTSGSNANEIIKQIDKLTADISQGLPKGIELADMMSTKDFLDASIHSVLETLIEAILLVIVVVYVFLQNLRSTLIPAISIFVSLIGTFAFLEAAGFSLNMLTLFALVLVIGTVVDDAIVVVEAVQAKFDEGYESPYLATIDAMGGITSALISTTLVFMAVFIPVCFMGGTTGTFYTQFGMTMAVAVAISMVNALTLSPALCALILTTHTKGGNGRKMSFSSRFHVAFDSGFHRLVLKYKTGVLFFLKHKWVAGVLLVMACGGLTYLMKTTKTGLVPQEDMGSIFIDVQAAAGSNLAETKNIMDQVEERIKDIPQIKTYSKVTGNSRISGQGASNGMFIIRLKPWNQRKGKHEDEQSVINEIYRLTADVTAGKVRASAQPMIPGYGASNGFEVYVQDQKGGTLADLQKYTNQMIDAMNKRPEISRAYTSFDTKYPQYLVEVDAARCKRNGVSPGDVLHTLSGYIGGNYASNMNRFSKLYRVMVQASPEYRLDTEALNNMFVRSADGRMSPVSQYLHLTRVYGAETLSRFNLFSAISINGVPADGYSSGQAISAIREVAAQTLPAGYGYEFGGMSREEASTGNTATVVFIICVVFIYLILCALYESLFIPLAVILADPFGLAGSFLFAKLFGLENNIYMQTALIMLIGLLSKTSILMTEYASARRKQGMSITLAAVSAAKVRLRPILMTSLTMIFGMLPMTFAHGVGANGNISLSVGTVGGIFIGTVSLLFIVPALFIVLEHLQEKMMPARALKGIAAVALLLATMSGCRSYQTYTRPDMPVVDSLYNKSVFSADTASLASLSWKELFTDSLLRQLVETGLQNNTDLKVTRLKVDEAEALLIASKQAYLPSATLAPEGTLKSKDGGKLTKSYNLATTADWELDIFGKLTNAHRGAKAALEKSKAYRQVVQTQLIATIANSYYMLLMLDKQLDISQRTAQTWNENLRAMKALKEAGQATEMAVAQTEANKLSVESSLFSLRQQISELENSLSTLLGETPQTIKRSTLDGQTFPESLSAGVPLQLLHNRPDIRQEEAGLEEAFYATNEAHAAFYPSITLSGSAGWTNAAGSAITNPGQWLFTAIGSIAQPLFSRGKNTANLKVAKAQQEEALLTFRQSLLDAGAEVNDALIQWQMARQRLKLSQQQIVSLQSAVRSSELLMQYRSENYLEVLTARQTLLQAELSTASDRFDEIQGVIQFYHALGGGE